MNDDRFFKIVSRNQLNNIFEKKYFIFSFIKCSIVIIIIVINIILIFEPPPFLAKNVVTNEYVLLINY